jgi:hypothetical protein
MTLTRLLAPLLLLALSLPFPGLAVAADSLVPTADELQHLIVRDTKIGTGAEAQRGNLVDVQYTG